MTSSMQNPINGITDEQRTAIITEWLARLRSGKVKQTYNRLRAKDTDGRCCLGVLCDVFIDTFPAYARWEDDGDISAYTFELLNDEGEAYAASRGIISPILAEMVGMHEGMTGDFVHLNDFERQSFIQIADVIEERLVRKDDQQK